MVDSSVPGFARHVGVALGIACAACASNPATPDAPSSAWTLGPALPRPAVDAGAAALGLQLVVVGGYTARDAASLTARVDVLDTTSGRWAPLVDAPVRWSVPNLAGVGGALYLLGGLDGGAARGQAYVLDAERARWTELTGLEPADARGGAGVVTAGGHIYLLGGETAAGAVASCVEYDVVSDRWSALPDLPAPRARPAAMRLIDGSLIVAGGLDRDGAPRSEVWALPPPGSAERTWRPRAELRIGDVPAARGGCGYGVVVGELVCAGGAGAAATRVDSYLPYVDMWAAREPIPVERVGAPAAAVGGRLYLVGGAAGPGAEPTDTLYQYSPLDTAPR